LNVFLVDVKLVGKYGCLMCNGEGEERKEKREEKDEEAPWMQRIR
jgi:hypothetical protein